MNKEFILAVEELEKEKDRLLAELARMKREKEKEDV